MIKYRQPIYDKGKFKEWHYWGIDIGEKGVDDYVKWMEYKADVTDPKDSQQFTGLYDKKKELYEGDIVCCNKRVFPIMWTGHGFNGVYMNENLTWDDEHEDGLRNNDMYELRGNITENPELLK